MLLSGASDEKGRPAGNKQGGRASKGVQDNRSSAARAWGRYNSEELPQSGRTAILGKLEQVHVRGFFCRGVRLDRFALLGMALAMPVWAATTQATQTRLNAEMHSQSGRAEATVAVSVAGQDGLPASGVVVLQDEGKPLAGAALQADGTAQFDLALQPGPHSLNAVYQGDTTHAASTSQISAVSAQSGSTPGFQLSVNPAALTLTAGQSGEATVSLLPVDASALTAPMFVTLSCSGLPDQSTCTFTPTNVEILPGATAAVTSDMVIATQSQGGKVMLNPSGVPKSNPVVWAVLLPGILGLGGLAFGARRRNWLRRLSLIALVALVSTVGMTACAPRYWYFQHGPNPNLPTPAGTYTLKVTAQTSNGITATTQSTSFALTVK